MNKLFKNKILLTMMMFVSSMALGVGVAQIQSFDYGIGAKIPFAFTVENTRLPAGNYVAVQLSDVDSLFELQNANNTVAVLLTPEDTKEVVSKTLTPEMVFDKIGDKYFLREMQTEDYGYKYAMSNQEKHLEMQGQKAESHSIKCTPVSMKKGSKKAMSTAGY